MTSFAYFRAPGFSRLFASAVALVALIGVTRSLQAQDPVPPPIMSYDPTITQVQGQLPIATTYPVAIQLFVPTGSPLTMPLPLTFRVSSTTRPSGVSEEAVAGFVTLHATAADAVSGANPITGILLAGPGIPEVGYTRYAQTVHVKVAYPATAVVGTYAFKIFAENPAFLPPSQGGLGVRNEGSEINGSVTAPVAPPADPPIVSISTPVNGSTIEIPGGTTFPVWVDFSFTATIDPKDKNPRPITSVSADIDGTSISLDPTVLKPTPVTGLGSTSVSVNVSMLVTGAGAHIVTARATNDVGQPANPDVHTFNVVIRKTPLTVTAHDQTRTYGSANPTLTYTIAGFTNGETLGTSGVTGAPNVTTTAATFSPVLASGTYPITPSLGSLASSKYDFIFVNGGLTITKAVLNVDAQPISKAYGAPVPTLPYLISGFLGTDTKASSTSGVPTLTTLATAASVPGAYGISTAIGSLSANNYSFVTGNSTLTINKGLLTFTALNASRAYGASNPPFSFTVGGFVNGDTDASAYQGDPTISTTATATSSVAGSPYPITIGPDADLISAKYDFAFVDGALAVTRAPLVVTADNKSKLEGAANPSLTYSITGLVNGESSAVLTSAPSLSTTATISSPVGSYPITIDNGSSLSAANYSVTFANGQLTVTNGSTTFSISGTVFFDANVNGARNPDEPGLGGVTVKLYQGNALVAQTTTTATGSAIGSYTFNNLAAGNYTVDAIELPGLTSSTASLVPVTITTATGSVSNVDIGMALNFSAIRTMKAKGFTIGYWKNNVEKAIAGKTGGAQVSAANIALYTTRIGTLALSPYNALTREDAVAIMGKSTSNPVELLSKQLVASEYNYESGGYIGGNQALTLCFITWGEYIVKNSANYSSTYIIYAQKWFDAYNNSHGGLVTGPLP